MQPAVFLRTNEKEMIRARRQAMLQMLTDVASAQLEIGGAYSPICAPGPLRKYVALKNLLNKYQF
jgi:hypothetical protein